MYEDEEGAVKNLRFLQLPFCFAGNTFFIKQK